MQYLASLVPNEFTVVLYTAIAGFIVGGIIKAFNKVLNKDADELDTHVALRKELREELDTVKLEVQQLQEELDEWRERYYAQVELTNELKVAVLQLTEELNRYKSDEDLNTIDFGEEL